MRIKFTAKNFKLAAMLNFYTCVLVALKNDSQWRRLESFKVNMDFVKASVLNQRFSFESELIDPRKYFGEYAKLLIPFETCQNEKCKKETSACGEENCKNDEFYINFLNISKEQLCELKNRTDVDHLTCDGELEPVSHDFYKKFNEESLKPKCKSDKNEVPETSLVSVKQRAEIADVFKTEFPRLFFKYCNYQWCFTNEKSSKNLMDFNSDDFSTLVFCVKIYHPILSLQNNLLRFKLLQEIHILGDQTLSMLRDKILCSLDYIGDRDLSSECFLKEVGVNRTAKDEYPSSFIFVENTFYNDTRSPQLIDLSKSIREWGSERYLGPFECKSMESTKLCDLKMKIGRPYVFQHQGDCEHLVVFSDIRFLELGDPSKFTSYPRIHCVGRIYGKHCMMCADSYARWLVVGNDRLTHDRTYLCKRCFLSYNYIDGKKIGQFEAYKYVDPVALI